MECIKYIVDGDIGAAPRMARERSRYWIRAGLSRSLLLLISLFTPKPPAAGDRYPIACGRVWTPAIAAVDPQ
jgi:hypothetical protein